MRYSRRDLMKLATAVVPLALMPQAAVGHPRSDELPSLLPVTDGFPSHPPELVREMVTVAHFDLKRVRELVSGRPALARAAWDWGFGDWEDALGAASHMGNRAIAEYLISQGARPSIFSATMLGQLEAVKALIAAQPGVQRISGPHSISLLAHAKAGKEGARKVYDFLQSLGDADREPEPPLAESNRAKLLGTYVFGIGASQAVDVTLEHNRFLNSDQLTWTRKGTMGRPLYHLGEQAFYPAGASSVRIKFAEENGGMTMTVHDPEPVLMARRMQPAK